MAIKFFYPVKGKTLSGANGLKKKISQSGMTLVELLIAVTVFMMLGVAIYSMLSYILKTELAAKDRVLASNIASSELEIVRNLSYDSVGVINGSPSGSLPQAKSVTVNNVQFNVSFDVRYVDDPFDGMAGGAPNDTNPADYKLVQAVVACANCPQSNPVKMTTTVAPPGIEGAGIFGFLFLKVTNAAGQPVSQAAVHIESVHLVPQRIIDSVTDNNGELKILDLIPAIQEYHVTAAKTGYTTDFTITPDAGNPNPLKTDVNISLGEVTPLTLQIDLASALNISSVTDNCAPVGNISFSVRGENLIGTNPDVYRYSQNFTTNGGGAAVLNNLRWDMYRIDVLSSQGYDIAGFIPLSPIRVDPGSVNNLKIILTPHIVNKNSLLATVKDASTLLPLTGIDVKLYDGNSGWEYIPHPVTGQGYFMQTDWSGPSGQKDYSTDNTGYYSTDEGLNITNPSGQIKLNKIGANYVGSGELISSTFDTGAPSNFIKVTWDPLVQPPQTGEGSVKFQIATSDANDAGTFWDFKGPDGTSSAYYTSANQNISIINNNHRYIRYKIVLSTENNSKTPTVESIAASFNSGCTPPGQAIFTGLSNGNFSIDATDANVPPTYSVFSGTVNVTGATNYEILLSP